MLTLDFGMLNFLKSRFSLRGTVLSLFFVIALFLISVVGIQLFYFSKKISLEIVDLKLHGLTQNISNAIQNDENSNFDTVNSPLPKDRGFLTSNF